MKYRHFILTAALTVSTYTIAQAANMTAPDAYAAELARRKVTPVYLDPDDAQLDAAHVPRTFDKRFATINVVTRQDLDKLSPANPSIAQALRFVPAINVIANGGPGALTTVSLRGSTASQVAVFIDGLRIGSSTSGIASWADIPTDAIERAEIISGPAAASFGADTMGGVIQLITRTPSDKPNQTTLSTGAGTHSTFDSSLRTSGTLGRFSYAAGVHAYNTAGIDATTPQAVDHEPGTDPYHARSLDARLAYRGDRYTATAFVFANRSSLRYDAVAAPDQQNNRQYIVGTNLRYALSAATHVRLIAGVVRDHSFLYRPGTPALPTYTYDTQRVQATGLLTHREQLGAAHGMQGETQLTYNFSREQVDLSSAAGIPQRFDNAFALHQSLSAAGHTVFVAGRHDTVGGRSVNTYNLAYSYQIDPVYLARVSYGTAFRLPTFNDLYYPGFSNPNLLPEQSRSVELGLDARYAHSSLALSLYDTRIHHLIAYDASAYVPVNVGRARIQGIDVTYTAHLLRHLPYDTPLRLTAAYMNPRDAITGRQLNRRPHVTAGLQIDHRFTARFAAGASLTYAGKTYDDAANTVPLAPYLLINARASYRFTPKLTGSVTVDNLFDRHYVTAAGYNQPGCTGFARLTYTF